MSTTPSAHAHVLLSITLALFAVLVVSTGAAVADTTHATNDSTHATPTNNSTVQITSPNATATANGTIAGETTLPAGEQLRVRIRTDANVSNLLLESKVVSVRENGTFRATFDLSENDPGDGYRVTVHRPNDDGVVDVLARTRGTLQTPETETPRKAATESETPTLTESETQTATDTETPTPTDTETQTVTEPEPQTTTTGTPGFTAVVGIVALSVASVALHRRR